MNKIESVTFKAPIGRDFDAIESLVIFYTDFHETLGESQVAQAQHERRQSSCETCPVVFQGFQFVDFVWEIHFCYQNAKMKFNST